MTWLNNGCALLVNRHSELEDKPINVSDPLDFDYLDDEDKKYFYFACKNIFIQTNNGEISYEKASYEYAKYFRPLKDVNVKHLSYSICFLLLPICYFTEKKKNYRNDLIQLVQLLDEPKNKYSQLLYYLVLNKTNDFGENVDEIDRNYNDFRSRYIQEGGTEAACKLFFEIHNAQNIEWWLNELYLYSTNLNASEFDTEMINYVASSEVVECDNFLLTMILTLYFHILEISRQSIIDYASENIHVTDEQDRFVYNILISNPESFASVYDIFRNSLFSVHFLNLINHDSKVNVDVKKDYCLAVQRYVEMICSNVDFVNIIPYYIASITDDKPQLIPQVLQNVFPALAINDKTEDDMLNDIIEKISSLESFEKEYSLKSIRKINEIKSSENKIEGYEISKFLNENFYETNQEVKLDLTKTILQSYDLQELQDIKESVIVDMMETYLDNDDIDSDDNENDHNQENISELLEQHLFDYIAANGDLPEFGK